MFFLTLKENYEILGCQSVFKNVHKNKNVKLILKIVLVFLVYFHVISMK